MQAFLLEKYHAKRLLDLDPWAPFRQQGVEAHAPAREVTINVDLDGPGEVFVPAESLKQPRSLFRNQPASLDQVSVTQLFVRNIKSGPKANYFVQTNFVPVAFQAAQAEQDRLHEAAGIPVRVVMRIPENKDESVLVKVHSSVPGDPVLNQGFLRSCAFLNNTNLWNGIVKVPDELRDTFPAQGEVSDPAGNREVFDVKDYYLVPPNHVLAWRLNVEDEWRRRKGFFAQEIAVVDKDNAAGGNKLLFFVVADKTLMELAAWTQDFFMNKVDLRPLTSVGFNFLPALEDAQGPVRMRVNISYLCWPAMTQLQIDSMLPTLHESTLKYADILVREIELAKRMQ